MLAKGGGEDERATSARGRDLAMQPHVSRRERAGSSLPRSVGRGCCRRRRKQCRVGARRTRAHAGLMDAKEMTYRRCEADGYLDGRRFAASREYVGSTVVLVELLLLLFTRACLSLPGAEIVVILVVSERMSNRSSRPAVAITSGPQSMTSSQNIVSNPARRGGRIRSQKATKLDQP